MATTTTTTTVIHFDLILRSTRGPQRIEIPVAVDLPLLPVTTGPLTHVDLNHATVAVGGDADIVVGLLATIRSAAARYLTEADLPDSPPGSPVIVVDPANPAGNHLSVVPPLDG